MSKESNLKKDIALIVDRINQYELAFAGEDYEAECPCNGFKTSSFNICYSDCPFAYNNTDCWAAGTRSLSDIITKTQRPSVVQQYKNLTKYLTKWSKKHGYIFKFPEITEEEFEKYIEEGGYL